VHSKIVVMMLICVGTVVASQNQGQGQLSDDAQIDYVREKVKGDPERDYVRVTDQAKGAWRVEYPYDYSCEILVGQSELSALLARLKVQKLTSKPVDAMPERFSSTFLDPRTVKTYDVNNSLISMKGLDGTVITYLGGGLWETRYPSGYRTLINEHLDHFSGN